MNNQQLEQECDDVIRDLIGLDGDQIRPIPPANRRAMILIEKMRAKIESLERQDAAAATYVETVICARTDFTGEHPYVGWYGLGLALNEALDERDRLRKA